MLDWTIQTIREKNILSNVKEKTKIWLLKRDQEELFYLSGFVGLLVIQTFLFFLDVESKSNFSISLFIPATLFLLGLGSYLLTQSLILKNPITKYIVGPASLALGASVTHAFSIQIINSAIEAPAAGFIHTQAILTVFAIPLVLAITFVFFGLWLAFFLLVNFSNLKDFGGFTAIIRLSTYVFAWSLTLSLLNSYSEPYTKTLENIAKWSIYNIESEKYSYCEKEEKQQVSYVSSEMILVSEKVDGKYIFKLQKCVSRL